MGDLGGVDGGAGGAVVAGKLGGCEWGLGGYSGELVGGYSDAGEQSGEGF